MVLELKHLAAYLPYGLKVQHNSFLNGRLDTEIAQVETLSDECVTLSSFMTEDYYFGSKENECEIKPILRPLSKFEYEDLIKVKEHLGLGKWCDAYDQYFDVWFDDVANVDKLILQCPYEIIQFFLECHFDIFGLIDAGLAVEVEDSHGR